MSSPALATPYRTRPLDPGALGAILVTVAAGATFPFTALSGALCLLACAIALPAYRRLRDNPAVMGAELAELALRVSLAIFAMSALPRLISVVLTSF